MVKETDTASPLNSEHACCSAQEPPHGGTGTGDLAKDSLEGEFSCALQPCSHAHVAVIDRQHRVALCNDDKAEKTPATSNTVARTMLHKAPWFPGAGKPTTLLQPEHMGYSVATVLEGEVSLGGSWSLWVDLDI